MATQIDICNMALAEIVAAPIQSFNEKSLEAANCQRFYTQSLNTLLESHEWGFATRRAILPQIVNPRAGEWAAAYALPTDVAKPLKIMSAADIAGIQSWWLNPDLTEIPYIIEDDTLYASATDAVLAYVSNGITAASFSARFVDALVYELASRLVMPIKKSREMKGDLLRQAETARQRAVADDLNRQPVYDTWSNQVQQVRDGCYGDINTSGSTFPLPANVG